MALFLSALAVKKVRVSELRKTLPEYVISKNRIELSDSELIDRILEHVKKEFANERITDIDGVKIDFDADKMWVHLRKSNTEPIIRVYSEACTEDQARKIADKVISIVNVLI